jgi:nitrogen fixation protein FixH
MPDSTPDTTDRNAETRHRTFWVGLILALLGGQIILMSAMAYVAVSDRSFAIEPDYYQKGLHWDTTAAQLRRNADLGWSLRIELGGTVSVRGERTLTCRLRDKAGQPLDGATLDLIAFPHARGNERVSLTLVPAGEGDYSTTVRFSRNGKWEFRLAVQRGPETFTQTVLRDVHPPGAS